MLIPDRDADNPLLTDGEVTAFLTLEGGNVYRAAAAALEMIGSDQLLILKVVRLMDLQVDGAAVAREARMRAQSLRSQAERLELYEDGGAFDWAEMVLTPFNAYERDVAEFLRESY